MVAGHLQEKNGKFYAVLSYNDEFNKRKTKWINTGLPVKGNKKRAEEFLDEQRKNFYVPEKCQARGHANELFADYLQWWLKVAKSSIALTTYCSYSQLVNSAIDPWFRKRNFLLREVTGADIQDFYTEQLKRVSANTVIHYHAVIHRALKYAMNMDFIMVNPADKVECPKKEPFTGNFYDKDEINRLFTCVEGSVIELPVKLATFYGLRRSEVLGLKWSAVDFGNKTLSINHTVTKCTVDGKSMIVARDTTKTRSSRRSLPLVSEFRDLLLRKREEQAELKRLCGRCYCNDYAEYICVNELGELLKPSYLTSEFSKVLKRNALRPIRFHDLRHSCASLLLANDVPLKQIQEWLGHSDFSTTANIYAHLDVRAKQSSAQAIQQDLGMRISC